LLTQLAETEAGRVCGQEGYIGDDKPKFGMKDTSGSVYGGGILGEVIAGATAKKANIPIFIRYGFTCIDEQDIDGKLTERSSL